MVFVWAFVAVFVVFGAFAFVGAPYVPSHRKYVRKAFAELHRLNDDDLLVDLGSGDGVVVREAVRAGGRAVGVEMNPVLLIVSKMLARGDSRQQYILANMWRYQLPDATTVVYVFSVTRDVDKLQDKLEGHVRRVGRPVYCITYGPSFKHKTPVKTAGAHYLYYFE